MNFVNLFYAEVSELTQRESNECSRYYFQISCGLKYSRRTGKARFVTSNV